MRKIIYDIEANGLQPDRIWCVVAKDVKTNEIFTFLEDQRDDFRKFTEGIETFIGHNILGYDNYWVKKLWGIDIPTTKCLDTLVLSRLFNSAKEVRTKKDGKWESKVKQKRDKHQHGLASWGEFLGEPKGDFTDFMNGFTQEMLDYCIQDVNVTHRVYNYLMGESKGFSKKCIDIEQALVVILDQQMRNGFKIDVPRAKTLLTKLNERVEDLADQIHKEFPPIPLFIKSYAPPLTKKGGHHTGRMGPMKEEYGFSYFGEPYSLIEWEEFNLSSPTQVVKRLKGHWKPVEFTKKGQPKCSEKNIETIFPSAPQSIKNIKIYRMLTSRVNEITSWIEGAEAHEDGRLRGRIIHLGSWSGRAAHIKPNTANIPSVVMDEEDNIVHGEEGVYGYECRSLFTADAGNVLIGCDASGIQLRILAHYLNNPEYTKAVLSPKPNDVHTLNAKNLDSDRNAAKKFIYSWLLGAGVAMTGDILNCSAGEAVNSRNRFIQRTPGLEDFLKKKTLYAQRGWYTGLDGRKVYLPSDHLTLTAFLQNGEHVIMAVANMFWTKWATDRGIPFRQVNYVHDEWETEVHPKYSKELAYLQEKSFGAAGRYLNLNCPLDGEAKIGLTWAEVH
jgi:DNA polymerase-1